MFITVMHCTITCKDSACRKIWMLCQQQGSHKCNSKNPSNSTKTFQKIPKSVVVQHIGVGAGKILGCKWSLPEFSRTCPKNSMKSDLQKIRFLCYFWRRWVPFLLIFSGVCSDFQGFCEGFLRFCPDFHGLFPDFHQIKTVRSQSRLLHQWCNIKSQCCDKC